MVEYLVQGLSKANSFSNKVWCGGITIILWFSDNFLALSQLKPKSTLSQQQTSGRL